MTLAAAAAAAGTLPVQAIPEGATAALIGYMINANRIDQTSFTAYYGR